MQNFLILTLTLGLLAPIAQAETAATLDLNGRDLRTDQFVTQLIRSGTSPAQVTIEAPAWKLRQVCLRSETYTYTGTCEGTCRQDMVCHGSGDEQTCTYVWNCEQIPCERSETYCVEEGMRPVRDMEKLKVRFRQPRRLDSGTQTYTLKTSGIEGQYVEPTLSADSGCADIATQKRKKSTVFTVRCR